MALLYAKNVINKTSRSHTDMTNTAIKPYLSELWSTLLYCYSIKDGICNCFNDLCNT